MKRRRPNLGIYDPPDPSPDTLPQIARAKWGEAYRSAKELYHDDEANTHAGLRNRKWPAGTEVSLVIETRSLHFHSNTNTNGVQPVARGAAEASWRDLPVIKRGSVAWGDGDPAALFGGRLEGGPWLVGTLRGIVDYVPLFRGAPCDNAASPAKRQGSFRRRLGGA